MLGKLRHFNPLQTPYIKINVKKDIVVYSLLYFQAIALLIIDSSVKPLNISGNKVNTLIFIKVLPS